METETVSPQTHTDDQTIIPEPPHVIKHLIVSGGGITGFSFYGVLRESNKCGFWDINNIQSVYGTSVGGIFSTLMCLLKKFDWETIDNYVLKRPWHQLFQFNLDKLLQAIPKKGIFDVKLMEELCAPFMKALDKTVDITLLEFYELTQIDLYLVSTELNTFQLEVFSHKTHPHWRLVDAIYCSSALPVLFSPFTVESDNDGIAKMMVDGGLLNNYPSQLCLAEGINPNEILGIAKTYDETVLSYSKMDTIFDYLLYIMKQLLEHIMHKPSQIKNQVNVVAPPVGLMDIFKGTSDVEERKRLINHGVETWKRFLDTHYPNFVNPPDLSV